MVPLTLAPSATPLSERYMSFAEREELAIQHAQGAGVRQIARQMRRSGSTISRELRRNAATRSGGLTMEPRRRSGMPNGPPVARSLQSWQAWWWQQAVLRFPDLRWPDVVLRPSATASRA